MSTKLKITFLITATIMMYSCGQHNIFLKEPAFRDSVQNLLGGISSLYTIEDQDMGKSIDEKGNVGGLPSKKYQLFLQLNRTATNEELIKMTTQSKNIGLRIYSFWGLALRHYSSIKSTLEEKLSDTTEIEFRSGCTTNTFKANTFYLGLLAPDNFSNPNNNNNEVRLYCPDCYKLKEEEFQKYNHQINKK